MKILYVVNQVPYPPDNGVRIVSYHAMRLMKELGHTVEVLVLSEETDNAEQRVKELVNMYGLCFSQLVKINGNRLFFKKIKSILLGRLYFVERHNSTEFSCLVDKTIQEFKPDSVHFDTIAMLQYRKNVCED
ncbi:MAG: glycosyltransferase family 4 protein, partial [Psychromonas sp.]|nr:glycosyltransferase family 4 protein [Psychromonas sp.]